ncbi:MAG: hypothetical protein ABI904_01880 [Chloroflexota bacterium]
MSRRTILILLCTLFILIAQPIHQAKAQTTPEVLKVGIYLIRAGALDISTGAIDVDFYIEFTCPTKCGDKTDFEIINGTTKSKPVLLADAGSETKPTYRVSATVFQRVDLKKYPFDSHDIKIIIESSNYDKSQVVYEVNNETTAVDKNVFILGWNLNTKDYSAEIVPQHYDAWNLDYTRYVFTAHLTKPSLAGWLKGLLPAVIIVLGALFALFITTKNVGNRVAIITSALVASVLYHMNFTSRVPPIGYLTFADTFMIINYFILLISLSLTIWIIRVDSTPDKPAPALPEKKTTASQKAVNIPAPQSAAPSKQELIARVNKLELTYVPVLWLVLQIINYVLVMSAK